jgi:hypothetical protein
MGACGSGLSAEDKTALANSKKLGKSFKINF